MKFLFGRSKQTGNSVSVRDAATGALHKYEKTFKDLAAYDRGERISVSR